MARIAVFDSGLGSLSVVGALRDICSCDIIYYADTASHPYGAKSVYQLDYIIRNTIDALRKRFEPDLIVVGSNTPTLMLDIECDDTIGVRPPLREAAALGSQVGVLATRAAISSGALAKYAKKCGVQVTAIDATILVAMVEEGIFWSDTPRCQDEVRDTIGHVPMDVCTLSSTHLPFLRHMLEGQRPDVTFLDPAPQVARQAAAMTGYGGGGGLEVYASSDGVLAESLRHLGYDTSVSIWKPF